MLGFFPVVNIILSVIQLVSKSIKARSEFICIILVVSNKYLLIKTVAQKTVLGSINTHIIKYNVITL